MTNQAPKKPTLEVDGRLSEAAETLLLDNASVLACECPKHLILLLNKVRQFQDYEQGCIAGSEADRETHTWLLEKGLELDRTLTRIILELAEREGMISNDGKVRSHPNR